MAPGQNRNTRKGGNDPGYSLRSPSAQLPGAGRSRPFANMVPVGLQVITFTSADHTCNMEFVIPIAISRTRLGISDAHLQQIKTYPSLTQPSRSVHAIAAGFARP